MSSGYKDGVYEAMEKVLAECKHECGKCEGQCGIGPCGIDAYKVEPEPVCRPCKYPVDANGHPVCPVMHCNGEQCNNGPDDVKQCERCCEELQCFDCDDVGHLLYLRPECTSFAKEPGTYMIVDFADDGEPIVVQTWEMPFEHALIGIKLGHQAARKGWNGRGMYIELFEPVPDAVPVFGDYPKLPYLRMKTADDKLVPWLASQTDLLADDWVILVEDDSDYDLD